MMETIRARNGHAQPFGYSSANYDGIQFSDPWARTSAPMSGHIAASAMATDNTGIPSMQRSMRNSLSSPFNLIPTSRTTTSPPVYATEIFPSNEMMNKFAVSSASYEPTSAPSATAGSLAYGGLTSGGNGYAQPYDQMQSRNNNLYNLQSSYQNNNDRRMSHPSVSSSTFMGSPVELRQRQNSLIDYPRSQPTNGSFISSREGSLSDALDSARGMMALSQTDTRLSMGGQPHRNSSTASASTYYPGSTTSSISSAQSYPYFGSVDSSSTELSSVDGMYDASRPSLPRPAGMIQSHGLPHQSGAQAMMSTFSSRVSSSTQKKHKCKICDKRFTRPSSLQTHMYSHTGEKPFACDVDGCGRQFSVVSNLRRHRKVHKGVPDMDTCSNHSG